MRSILNQPKLESEVEAQGKAVLKQKIIKWMQSRDRWAFFSLSMKRSFSAFLLVIDISLCENENEWEVKRMKTNKW